MNLQISQNATRGYRRFGRFDQEIEIGVPNEFGLLEVLHIHRKNMNLDEEINT